MYKIALDNGHEALGYTAGKMRRYRITSSQWPSARWNTTHAMSPAVPPLKIEAAMSGWPSCVRSRQISRSTPPPLLIVGLSDLSDGAARIAVRAPARVQRAAGGEA